MSGTVERAFEKIGARLRIDRAGRDPRLDVVRDMRGELFEIRVPRGIELTVLDVDPRDQHLLLLTRDLQIKSRYLFGHDERAWFVAAIPETSGASTVDQAKEALKPGPVLQRQAGIRGKLRSRRRNPAYVRQGEWFFLPEPSLRVHPLYILRNEPLTRGPGSNVHLAQEAVRFGGRTVHILRAAPSRDRRRLEAWFDEQAIELDVGLTDDEHDRLLADFPEAKRWSWQIMRRDPDVYVRGRVSHPEHRTVVLDDWHRVLMNTEPQSLARRTVAFLD